MWSKTIHLRVRPPISSFSTLKWTMEEWLRQVWIIYPMKKNMQQIFMWSSLLDQQVNLIRYIKVVVAGKNVNYENC